MKKLLQLSVLAAFIALPYAHACAQGEASTYFNVFVPPNNDPVKRNVCVVVTAIFDDTTFEIIDDGMDGDTDDSKTGTLARGQSYILYIADNGINDDARYASGGVLKQDGDYFIIKSSKNVLVSQSTNSDWQHDFVPAISQKAIGERFFVYAPQISNSKRDLNAFVYEDSTLVTIKRISTTATTSTGYTNINYDNGVVIGTQLLNRGQDIIYYKTLGRDVMETGHTYMIEASRPITLQYGALFGNERDGGGNVPSSNGSSSGELFYFAVPYQVGGEQEIRLISWDDNNAVKLERFNAGTWVPVKTWNLNRHGFSDWVGKTNGNVSYPTVFRVTATPGKRVSVFEANWLETGNPGTSDIGSMLTSENGTSAGKKFIAYMAPPGNQQNVMNPFTGALFGQPLTHLYISSRTGARVTVRDAFTNGKDFSQTYDIAPERYVDCYLTLSEWKKIYNGTGTVAGGAERPYLVIESDKPVSVFNTNFNDNWMAYLGTAQLQEFSLQTETPNSAVIPGDSTVITTEVVLNGDSPIDNTEATLQVEGNVQIVSSTLNESAVPVATGVVSDDSRSVTFTNLPNLTPKETYTFTTTIVATVSNTQGELFIGNSVGSITSQVTGTVDGVPLQAVSSNGIFVNSADQRQLLFTRHTGAPGEELLTNSWTVNLVDINNDSHDDVFITERDKTKPNYLYKNNGNGTFTRITTGDLVTDAGTTVSASWADIDNDGDLDALIANNTEKPNRLFINNGNGNFTKMGSAPFAQQPAYYHNATWVDYDNDGLVDLFLCNYWPTKFNELWHNDGNGSFTLQENSPLSKTPGSPTSATWTDYDHDGLMDVFLPNNKNGENALYHNEGGGNFKLVNNLISQEGGYSVASCWGDLDGNGFQDLFVANASNQNNYLYWNQGNGQFKKELNSRVVRDGGHSHGCSFADFDNDGDLDLYVSNDSGEKFLYENKGAGSFERRLNEVLTVDYGNALGHAWADLDKDGDLDLFSVTHGNERNHLFWNNGSENEWLQVKLVGVTSNRSAVGARIHVKCDGKWQMREVVSQSGIGGQSSYRAHFGLGQVKKIDSLVVQWPSGMKQFLTNLSTNKFLEIKEETGTAAELTLFVDENRNCKKDEGENYLANQTLRLSPGNRMLITDAKGRARVSLSDGVYTATLGDNSKYELNCNAGALRIPVSGHKPLPLGEIAVQPVCECGDGSVDSYSTALRRGFPNQYFVVAKNEGTLPLKEVEVTVTVPDKLHFIEADIPWQRRETRDTQEIFSWALGTLQPGQEVTIQIQDVVTLGFQVGDEAVVYTSLTSASPEVNLDNNKMTASYEIVGSIDPNLLIASPKGAGDQRVLESGAEITYQVQFENFGTYPTAFVTVVDTLPALVDMASLHDIQSSHEPVQTSITDNIVTFYFPSVELTPASVDSVKSKGFVQFRVRTVSGARGKLSNRAAIFFDYNEPIITNTETYTMVNRAEMQAGSVQAFPNPATGGLVHLILNPSGDYSTVIREVQLVDLGGKTVTTMQTEETIVPLAVENMRAGLYIVKAIAADNRVYLGKLMITN